MRTSTLLLTLISLPMALSLVCCTGSSTPAAQPGSAATAQFADTNGDGLPDTRIPAAGAGQATASKPTAAETPAPATASSPNQTANPSNPTMNTASPVQSETATFGAGCFWCIEAVLLRIEGVLAVESGYMGGKLDNPTYEDVCTGTTGHAEVVRVQFDPSKLSYGKLCDWFFEAHDPTTLNRQGNDHGTQYRSAIFYDSDAQRQEALAAKERAKSHWTDPIVTEITKADTFWRAEGYHQNYWANNPSNPYCRAFIPSKLKKLGLEQKAPIAPKK